MRLRYGQELSERDRIPLRSLIQRYDYSPSYRAKSNRLSNVIVRNLIVPCEIHYRDRSNAFNACINYYIYAEDEKLVQELGKVCFRRHWLGLYPHLTEDSEIFSSKQVLTVLFEKYDGQPVIIWNDRRGPSTTRRVGVMETFINVLIPPTSQQNIKYLSIKLINEVNIVNSKPTFTDFLSMVLAVRIQPTKTKTKHADAFQLFRCVLRTLTF